MKKLLLILFISINLYGQKISDLPLASTPLSNSDLFYTVQTIGKKILFLTLRNQIVDTTRAFIWLGKHRFLDELVLPPNSSQDYEGEIYHDLGRVKYWDGDYVKVLMNTSDSLSLFVTKNSQDTINGNKIFAKRLDFNPNGMFIAPTNDSLIVGAIYRGGNYLFFRRDSTHLDTLNIAGAGGSVDTTRAYIWTNTHTFDSTATVKDTLKLGHPIANIGMAKFYNDVNGFSTLLKSDEPSADRIIMLPLLGGNLALTSIAGSGTGNTNFTTGKYIYSNGTKLISSAYDSTSFEPTLTKGNLTESVTGLQFDNTRQVIGGAAALSLSSGYVIPTTTQETNWGTAYTNTHTHSNKAKLDSLTFNASVINGITSGLVTNWNTAYTNRITSLTTTGSSGASTLVSNTLNIPNYTLAGLGGVSGSGTINELAYWTGATSLGTLAVATYPSLTELSYVKGVTSSIQTQINSKTTLAAVVAANNVFTGTMSFSGASARFKLPTNAGDEGNMIYTSGIGIRYIDDDIATQTLADQSWVTSNFSMVYPGAGIALSTGSAWGTSITNNSANWNTAYGWGNHAGLYPLYNGTGATGTWGIGISGNAGTVTNGVYTIGDQTIGGSKTLSGLTKFSYGSFDLGVASTTEGYINFYNPNNSYKVVLSGIDITTSNKTIQLPNISGTIALTSDLSSYVPTSRTISTTSPLSGGGTLSGNLTLAIANAVADGSTKGAASFTANDFDALSGNISLDYTNGYIFRPTYAHLAQDSTVTISLDDSWVNWGKMAVGDTSGVTVTIAGSNDKAIVNRAGKFRISYSVTFSSNTAGEETYFCIYKNGSTELSRSKSRHSPDTVNKNYSVSGEMIATLNATDYLQLKVYTYDATNITLTYTSVTITKVSN
uniref:Uncharacterized protein n=1 Tax=viral metagenome TaxID=1070528 RepID=A0A6M3IYP0_9ZZZZ